MIPLPDSGLTYFSYDFVILSYASFIFVACCGISLDDHWAALKDMRALMSSMLLKVALLPGLCLLISMLFFASAGMGSGLMMITILPSYSLCVFLTWMAGGSMASAYALLILMNVLSVIIVPVVYIALGLILPGQYEQLQADGDFMGLMIYTSAVGYLLPGIAAGALRQWRPAFASMVFKRGMAFFVAMFIIAPLVALIPVGSMLAESILTAGLIVAFSFLFLFIFTYFAAAALGNSPDVSKAIAFTVCTGNSVMSVMFMASDIPGRNVMFHTVLWWFMVQYYLGAGIALWMRYLPQAQEKTANAH